jgi:hypothetical protein
VIVIFQEKKIAELEITIQQLKSANVSYVFFYLMLVIHDLTQDELTRTASQSSSRGAIINDLKADLNEKAKLQNDLQVASDSLGTARMTTEALRGELKVHFDVMLPIFCIALPLIYL